MFNLPRNCPLSLLVLWSAGIKLSQMRDFPGGPMIQNPPSNAGNVGSIPCQETKMPHAEGQLNPRTPQLGSSRAITKTPHRQKIKKNKKKNCFLKKKNWIRWGIHPQRTHSRVYWSVHQEPLPLSLFTYLLPEQRDPGNLFIYYRLVLHPRVRKWVKSAQPIAGHIESVSKTASVMPEELWAIVSSFLTPR